MASLFGELSRRHVFRVAAAYAVVAWLVVQVAAIVFPAFEAPPWVLQSFIVVIALGFPVCIVMAWIYDLTPAGIVRTESSDGRYGIGKLTRQRIDFLIIGALALAVGVLLLGRIGNASALDNSVAVLPFANLSPDPDNAYFSSGIHDTVVNELAKVRDMSVIARTSVARYGDGETALDQIARQLNVETIMTGSVQYAGSRVRVAVQLIDPMTGTNMWSEIYDRHLDDIFAVQTDIAMRVAEGLEATLLAEEALALTREASASAEAYTLYLRANEIYRETGNRSDRRDEVLGLLDQALEIDDQFALAYALRSWYEANQIIDTFPTAGAADERDAQEQLARGSANRALSLDPTAAFAYLALASMDTPYWRWTDAERSLENAIELNPGHSVLLAEYSQLQSFVGDYDSAIEAGRRAVELDPNNADLRQTVGAVYAYGGRIPEALRELRAAVELAPRSGLVHLWLGHVENIIGNTDAASNALQTAEDLIVGNRTGPPLALAALAYAYSRNGRSDKAEEFHTRFEQAIGTRSDDTGSRILASLAVDAVDDARQWLERAVAKVDGAQVDDGFFNLMMLRANIYGDARLEQPEFRELRMQLSGL